MDFFFRAHLRSSLSRLYRSSIGFFGFAHFHRGPGPWFAMRGHQFLPGSIHASVRMCKIVVCGWERRLHGALGKAATGQVGGGGGSREEV